MASDECLAMPFRRSAVLSAYFNNKRALICPNHNVEDRGAGTYNLIDRLDFSHHERKKSLQWYAGTISDNPELVGRELLAPNGSTVTTGCGPTQNYRGAVSRCTYAHTKASNARLPSEPKRFLPTCNTLPFHRPNRTQI